jgi:hypothetical protein
MRPPSRWGLYRDKFRQEKIKLPGMPHGRVGHVTIQRRGDAVSLRWREDGKPRQAPVGSWSDPAVIPMALEKARDLNRRLFGRPGLDAFAETPIPEAIELFLQSKEAGESACAASIQKYRAEFARLREFAANAPEGRRCRCVHEIDTSWCEAFSRWLDAVRTTRNGGIETPRNPLGPLTAKGKREVKRRARSLLDYAALRSPPLVPPGFRNPLSKELIGRDERIGMPLCEPPVVEEDLVRIVGVLDAWGLGVLGVEFLYGPRPSEQGPVLIEDYDRAAGVLVVRSRPETGYLTKGRCDKAWPVTAALAACLRPFLARTSGAVLIKRAHFEGRSAPVLANATAADVVREFERLQQVARNRVGRALSKAEVEDCSRAAWAATGAVTAKDVARELASAARRAGLNGAPTPKDVRHLFESTCEAARLSPGVIRHLMGHAPQRGDALHHYNHVTPQLLHEQAAVLDERRRPLVDAIIRRAAELQNRAK